MAAWVAQWAPRPHVPGMAWDRLAEARIQEWLRKPEEERKASASRENEPPRPLELELLDRIEAAIGQEHRAVDPAVAAAAGRRARDAETQLFALLDATGRSVLAPVLAARIADLRRGS